MQKPNKAALKKIVFINQATGYLTIDIINAFANDFDKVALISGSIRVQDIELNKNVTFSTIIKYDRGNPARKLTSWLIGTLQIYFLLLTKYRSYDIFYITIPPSAYLLSAFLKNKFSILIFDVYPDVLKIYNINEGNWLYKFWGRQNKKIFAKAHRVYTIGEGMAKLVDAYMSRNKMVIIPNWSGLTKLHSVSKENNPWIKRNILENKFIVQYSGNIGYTHNVEELVEIAKELKNEKDLIFLIIGRGEKVKLIQELITTYQLNNCLLMPFQADNELNYSLAAADLGVVLLDDKTSHVSIPSKIYNLQAVGVPLLGIASMDSELNKHIEQFHNGKCFPKNDKQGIIDFILNMKNHPDKQKLLSENSKIAAQFFTNANAGKYLQSYVS
ncbi:MAG: glycosyltransferase family 4 protein [Bacteroidia bacterium]|nr:glycosyltransferase family 4 protein [Bacteroidia bacterium]